MSWIGPVKKYFGLIFLVGIVLGFFFGDTFRFLGGGIVPILAGVMTLSFLSIDFSRLKEAFGSAPLYLLILGVFKVALPGLLFLAISPFNQDIALAVLLLSATSVAVISTTLTELLSGDTVFILILVILSSLIAPFQLPFVLRLYAGKEIGIDAVSMMVTLIKIVLVPFAISILIKLLLPGIVKKTVHSYGAVSILLIFFLRRGVIASGSGYIRSSFSQVPIMLALAYGFGALSALLGYWVFFFLPRDRRTGLSVSVLYMNIGLSVVIAAKYFSPLVLLFCVLYQLPANTIPVFIRRLNKDKSR